MENMLNNLSASKDLCVSFDEASEMLKYVLNEDLDYFLQEHGFMDENLVPYKEEMDNNVFKCRHFEKDLSKGGFYGDYYFITESGLKEIFNIALTQYLLEQPVQIRL
jgi:phage antirepressor YoqD-like protein